MANDIERFEKENLSLMQNFAYFEKQMKELKAEQDKARTELLEAMQKYGVRGIDNELLKITVVSPSVSYTIDTKKFRADDPDAYEEYLCRYKKVTERKESLRITVK